MNIIIQLIGVLGILSSIISFQCKRHNFVMLFRTLNEFVFAIQYFLLGAYTGMAMNLVGCVRNIMFAKQVSGNKNTSFVRKNILITSSSWLVYNALVFSIAGVVNEAFTIVSIIVGIIRLDIIPMLKKKNV